MLPRRASHGLPRRAFLHEQVAAPLPHYDLAGRRCGLSVAGRGARARTTGDDGQDRSDAGAGRGLQHGPVARLRVAAAGDSARLRRAIQGSRVAREPGDRCGSAIDRAILISASTPVKMPLAGLSLIFHNLELRSIPPKGRKVKQC